MLPFIMAIANACQETQSSIKLTENGNEGVWSHQLIHNNTLTLMESLQNIPIIISKTKFKIQINWSFLFISCEFSSVFK